MACWFWEHGMFEDLTWLHHFSEPQLSVVCERVQVRDAAWPQRVVGKPPPSTRWRCRQFYRWALFVDSANHLSTAYHFDDLLSAEAVDESRPRCDSHCRRRFAVVFAFLVYFRRRYVDFVDFRRCHVSNLVDWRATRTRCCWGVHRRTLRWRGPKDRENFERRHWK